MSKSLVLGCCSTGAKFTPRNHKPIGDEILDRIYAGDDIAVGSFEVTQEIAQLSKLGCRYYHYHARDFVSREQTTDNEVYRRISGIVQRTDPDMLISFGASRNGPEVTRRIGLYGEWERVSHAALSLDQGGAHFITLQAAIELQMIRDLEDGLGRTVTSEFVDSDSFADIVGRYQPSMRAEEVRMETNSTANGSNYGRSSPAVQMQAYGQAIAARRRLHLLDEIEWVQLSRSYAMSRMAIQRPDLTLSGADQLNVTLLFGFSPKMPFPRTYDEFRSAVALAKSLERDCPGGPRRRAVSITVGAAVLPKYAAAEAHAMDVGPDVGRNLDPIRRIVTYAAQDDSEVDIVRVGMEDTPYVLTDGGVRPTNNVELCRIAADMLDRCGVMLRNDPSYLTERRAPLLQRLAA